MPFCAGLHYRFFDGGSERFVLPVILLHGAGGSLMGWPASLRRLPGQRVFALDLPGHGQSAPPACRSMRGLVRSLHKFIMEMGFYHVVLVGYSLGGALALSYASAYPDQVSALATICCGDRFESPREVMDKLRKPADLRKAMEIFNRAAFYPTHPQAARRAILAPMLKLNAETLLADFTIGEDFCFNPASPLPKFPTLIAGALDDMLAPPASLRRLSRHFHKPSVSFINRAAHMLIYEKNEEIRTIVANFLTKANPPG